MTVATALAARERAVLAKVEERTRSRRRADGDAFVVAVRHPDPEAWAAPCEHALDSGWALTVAPCGSVLAVLDALATWSERPRSVLAVVTDLTEADLGDAILARVDGEALVDADRHTLLESVLGTRSIDARIRKESWLVDALLGLAADQRLRPQLGTTLSRRRALAMVAADRLGVDPEEADLGDLVLAFDDADVRRRWRSLPTDEREGLREYLVPLIGAAAALLADLAERREEVLADLLALQAVTAATSRDATDPGAAVVYGRATQSRFGTDPARAALVTLADAAVDAARRVIATSTAPARADAMLDELGAVELAVHSPVLPRGHTERLARAAADLSEANLADVHAHARHADQPWRYDRLRAALRLRRWLATEPRDTVDGVTDGLRRHARELAYVDRALHQVEAGDPDARVRAVLGDVARSVHARRADIDIAFARRLATARETPIDLLAVETFLSRRVAPLMSAGRDVLLVVVDGMSGAVAGDLADELDAAGWTEMVATEDGAREAVLAALPTETQFSRSSLLRGRLVRGRQDREAAEFPTLFPAGTARIVHKAGVRGEPGADLGADLDGALSPEGRRPLVAVVLNAVDDSLPKGRASSDPTWTVADIPGLEPVLSRAQETGRAVLLVSDHGHVLENGSRLRTARGGGARWRPVDGATEPDEVAVDGPRVLTDDGRAVLAAVEGLRYGKESAGYHGGATLAEVAIPLIALLPPGVEDLPGWAVRSAAPPSWWSGAEPVPPAPTAVESPRRPARTPRAPAQSEGLFDAPAPAAPPARATRGATLVASRAFRDAHAAAAGRAVPEPEVFARVVDAVLAAGGRAPIGVVAAAAGRPVARVRGLVAVLAQVLNRDSFPVLALVDNTQAVVVDRALLDDQFPERT